MRYEGLLNYGMFKMYDTGLYLVSLYTGLKSNFASTGDFPQARCTVDDFGDLVVVRDWL